MSMMMIPFSSEDLQHFVARWCPVWVQCLGFQSSRLQSGSTLRWTFTYDEVTFLLTLCRNSWSRETGDVPKTTERNLLERYFESLGDGLYSNYNLFIFCIILVYIFCAVLNLIKIKINLSVIPSRFCRFFYMKSLQIVRPGWAQSLTYSPNLAKLLKYFTLIVLVLHISLHTSQQSSHGISAVSIVDHFRNRKCLCSYFFITATLGAVLLTYTRSTGRARSCHKKTIAIRAGFASR